MRHKQKRTQADIMDSLLDDFFRRNYVRPSRPTSPKIKRKKVKPPTSRRRSDGMSGMSKRKMKRPSAKKRTRKDIFDILAGRF